MDLKIRQLFAPSSVEPTSGLVATIAALLAAIVGLWAGSRTAHDQTQTTRFIVATQDL